MKKMFSFLLVSMATGYAVCQDIDLSKVAEFNYPCPEVAPYIPLGWTLAKTIVEDGITRSIYVKEVEDEEDSIFVYLNKDNGDYNIYERKNRRHNILCSKEHQSNGIIRTYQKDPYFEQLIYPNGMVVSILDKEQKKICLHMPDNLENGYFLVSSNNIRELNKGNNGRLLWFPLTFDESHDYVPSGFPVGDRFYEWDYKEKENVPKACMQKIKGKYFSALSTDTIVDIKTFEKKDTIINGEKTAMDHLICETTYKNGDRYKYVYKRISGEAWRPNIQYQILTLHRMDGVLKITKKDATFTKKDGTIFRIDDLRVGEGKWIDAPFCYNRNLIYILTQDSLRFSGNVTYPDGTEDYIYSNGRRKSIVDREEKAEAKKEEAKKKAIRDSYIKKYGYYPGDYQWITDILKPGRKFGAIEEYFAVELVSVNGTTKKYKVYNQGRDFYNVYKIVWVKNGIITSVNF